MKLSKVVETGAAIGAATLAGINAFYRTRKEQKIKKSLFTRDHIALYSSLFAAGLALWEIRKHHHAGA